MLNDRMQTAISFYKEASAKKMLVSGDNLNEDYDEVSVMKKLAVSGGIEADEVYMDHTGLNTYDTIVHSLEFFNKGSTIVIVTQSYHLYRALIWRSVWGLMHMACQQTAILFTAGNCTESFARWQQD